MLDEKNFTDVRNVTDQIRREIGFPKYFHDWKDEPAKFTNETLTILGHPVMERWEQGYMEELATIATQRGGVILEVGYGMGISAKYIQENTIQTHIIVEANNDVFKELEQFATHSLRPVKPLKGFWQEVTKSIPDGSITGILFDTYPLTENEIHCNHFTFFSEAYRMLETGGILTYYSDEITDFSPTHLNKLTQAGFTNVKKKICHVSPPEHCQYWKSDTILAPIVIK